MIYNFPIKGEKVTVTRPIVHGVINDLKKMLNIGIFDVPIVYLDEEGVRKEKGTSTQDKREGIIPVGNESLQITVTEEPFDQTLLLYQQYDREFMPIFAHEETGTHISPYYSHMEMKLNIQYKAQSRATCLAWLNSIKSKIRLYGDAYPHNLEYYYQIDNNAIYILTEVYKLIKKVNPNTENISDWMQNHFNHRFGTASDSAGLNKMYIVSESQQQIIGYFDFDGMIEDTEKIEGTPGWRASFGYLIRYMKPTDISIYYSPVIYNQIVPKQLMGPLNDDGTPDREKPPEIRQALENRIYTQSQFHLKEFSTEHIRELYWLKDVVKIPRWNEFSPEQLFSIAGNSGLLDMLVLMQKDDKPGVELINLVLQKEAKIDFDLLTFLLFSEVPYILHTGKSVFQLLFYQNGRMMYRDSITFNHLGQIKLNTEIDLSNIYNVRLAVYYDLSLVDPEAIDRLINWNGGSLVDKVFGDDFKDYYHDHYEVDEVVRDLIDFINGKDDGGNGSNLTDDWEDHTGKDIDRETDRDLDPDNLVNPSNWVGPLRTVQTFYTINYRNHDHFLEDSKR